MPLINQSTQSIQYNTALRLADCTSVDCLRSLPAPRLATLNQAVQNATYPGPGVGFGIFSFGPVVDGKFIKELPGLAFQRGNFYDVPIIVDHEGYEGVIFSNASLTAQIDETADAQDIFPYAGPAFFSRLYQLYPRSDFNSTFFQRQTWFGDFIINCPTTYIGFNAIEHNSNRSTVWKMVFNAGSQLHGATVPFLASNTTDFPAANNQTLAGIMSSYWISFAVMGDPNPLRADNAAFWGSYISGGNGTVANGESVGFQVNSITYTTVGMEDDPDISERCEFFGAHVSFHVSTPLQSSQRLFHS